MRVLFAAVPPKVQVGLSTRYRMEFTPRHEAGADPHYQLEVRGRLVGGHGSIRSRARRNPIPAIYDLAGAELQYSARGASFDVEEAGRPLYASGDIK